LIRSLIEEVIVDSIVDRGGAFTSRYIALAPIILTALFALDQIPSQYLHPSSTVITTGCEPTHGYGKTLSRWDPSIIHSHVLDLRLPRRENVCWIQMLP
jgi:hypothetical protein